VTVPVCLVLVALTMAPSPVRAEEPQPPGAGARAALVMDAESGAVLYERNARVPLHPASLTKMVTALVAVERAPLDKVVRVARPIVVIPVLIGLEPGDELRLEDVLYGLLLDSGNDAAIAIAESVGDGSSERFVGWIVAQGRHEVEGPPRWVFRTRNPLLGVYDGVDGIKTGYDDLAGRCLVATATRDGRRAISVVMNSPGYDLDSSSLLDYAFSDMRWGPPSSPKVRRDRAPVAMLRADLADAGDAAPRRLGRAAQAISSGSGELGS
jgi:D-alanyl-D-alanine carboxypeptidase